MKKSFNLKSFGKWAMVIFAVAMAGYQAFADQKEQERVEEMEERIAKLEEGRKESE